MEMYFRKTPFITTSPIVVEKKNSSTEIARTLYSITLQITIKTQQQTNSKLTTTFFNHCQALKNYLSKE